VNEAIAVGGYILLALCELAIALGIVLGCAWLINRISKQG
jgi:flagellar biogenesis protein FliO